MFRLKLMIVRFCCFKNFFKKKKKNFFFFQAEDGIRDHCVTGVQTCALPISARGVCVFSPTRAVSPWALSGAGARATL